MRPGQTGRQKLTEVWFGTIKKTLGWLVTTTGPSRWTPSHPSAAARCAPAPPGFSRAGTAARPRLRRGRRPRGNRECAPGPAGGPTRTGPWRLFRNCAGGARPGGFAGPSTRKPQSSSHRSPWCRNVARMALVALAFEGVFRRRLQERPGLAVARAPASCPRCYRPWPFDAAHRVVAHRVGLAQVVEERGNGRELAPDGAGGQAPALQVFKARRSGGRG
jgi:hypothetical protein